MNARLVSMETAAQRGSVFVQEDVIKKKQCVPVITLLMLPYVT